MADRQSQGLQKSISFFGLITLGLGGVWGTSWLLVASSWLEKGGGIVNALLAWVLILILELPFVLAYRQAVPMFPKAEGEMSYAKAAFGPFAGFTAAWFGILVNLIVCAYEVVSLVRMVEFLAPSVTSNYWYKVMGAPVGTATIILGIVMVLAISMLHYRGVKLSSGFQKITSTTLMVLVGIGVIMAFAMGSFGNFKPLFGKPMWQGVIAVTAMLPFSLAGWETIAKGAEEASEQAAGSSGKAVPIAWATGWFAYVASLVATGLVMPWQEAQKLDIPFASGLNSLTGSAIPGLLLIITALIGVIGVYNALFYAVTRQMFGMARQGILPGWLAEVHPKYGTPKNAIFLSTAVLLIAPFLGRKLLIPLVDAASFAYIFVWGLTFLSIVALGKRTRQEKRFALPGGALVEGLGYVSIAFLLVVMLYPKSPAALVWPLEHTILIALIALGLVLYGAKRSGLETAPQDRDQLQEGGIRVTGDKS